MTWKDEAKKTVKEFIDEDTDSIKLIDKNEKTVIINFDDMDNIYMDEDNKCLIIEFIGKIK